MNKIQYSFNRVKQDMDTLRIQVESIRKTQERILILLNEIQLRK